jgi:GNAT superfamily N-acetyltransferase
METSVRRASISDLEVIVELNRVVQRVHALLEPTFFKAVTRDGEIAAFFADRLASEDNYIALAYREGRPVGYVWFEKQVRRETPFTFERKSLYVHHIAVEELVRRRGVASALLSHVQAEARAWGIERIVLDAWVANQAAHVFFEKQGFLPIIVALRKSLA